MQKNILLGVCGGIASYKTCELVRLLVKNKFCVKVVMTDTAVKFVTPLVFQNLSNNPVYLDMFTPLPPENLCLQTKDKRQAKIKSSEKPCSLEEGVTGFTLIKDEGVKHIDLAVWADICVIAPLSANTLSKIANGLCDNLLTTVVCALAQDTKVILAPAMNENMWINTIIQENIKKLRKIKKYIVLNPEKGELACGSYGEGRMPQPIDIYKKITAIIR